MEKKQKTIMAVGAHTGDAQLTCGMLLAKHALAGDRVVIVDLTAGERGTPPGMSVADFRKQNVDSAAEFAHLLSGESVVLGTPDGELTNDMAQAVALGDLMRKYEVDAVLCHWKHSLHRDHVVAHQLTQDAVFYGALPTFERPLPPAPIKRVWYAENWEDAEGFVPYVYADVTEAYPLWEQAVKKLWLTEHSRDFKYLQYYDALSRMRGALMRTGRATAFGVEEHDRRTTAEYA